MVKYQSQRNNKMMNPDVISIGDITTDILLYVPNYPKRGQDVKASRFRMDLGGSATNFAVAVRRLGISSGIIGKIGDDELGNSAFAKLKKEKIDTHHVGVEKGSATGIVISVIDRKGERTMFSARGANDRLKPDEIDPKYVQKAMLLHISGYSLIHRISREAILRYAQIARKSGVLTSFDPGPLISLIKPKIIRQILKLTDIFLPNLYEMKIASRSKNIAQSIENILSFGPKIVGLKLGGKGCIIAQKTKRIHVPAVKAKVVDTTGAGDAWGAGFLTALLRDPHDLEGGGKFANAVAALSVGREGASSSMPSMQEVEDFLAGTH